MKFVEEYRDGRVAARYAALLARSVTRPWTVMEVCGGQTHAIVRFGIDQLLPQGVTLAHGPGCPVCVTSLELVDKALAIASSPGVIFATFGDMIRVPGSRADLFSVRAAGGQVKIVYSPLDTVKLAQQNPDRQVVFFAIGFETTAPANAAAVLQAQALGLKNFSLLVSQVRVPPAMKAILSSPDCRVQAFLAAGHVCAVMGYHEYPPIATEFGIPISVTGFEPLDLVYGVLQVVRLLESGQSQVDNAYPRVVTYEGNVAAQNMIKTVFTECDRNWRGIGMIPGSGWKLNEPFATFDAEKRFDVGDIQTKESAECIAGSILQGLKKPPDCPAFGVRCTPENPLGATMVSSEGACAAYYRYHRQAG